MKHSANYDKPMSLNADGTPKKFEVMSAEPIYDGAILQKLNLQEYTEI
jgi:hypothetical protein